MAPVDPPPDATPLRPASARPPGLAPSCAALVATLPVPRDPAQAGDATETLRRIARGLRDSGGLDGRPELLAATDSLLAAESSQVESRAAALVDLLTRTLETEGGQPEQTVLLIEDDPLFCRALASTLTSPGRRVVATESAAAARTVLRQDTVHLVVLDLILPDSDGRNILLELRSDPRTSALPVFVVSARLGTGIKAECFALGGDAYFEKPVDLEAFAVAVSARLERHADQSHLARRDPVTGLPNRAAFLESTTRLREASPPETGFSLAVIDLDHFRWVEETWGRQFSEIALRRAGIRLAMALRQAAVFARWDGAEFMALFAGRGPESARAAVDQALVALRKLEFLPSQGAPITLTFSAGVCEVPAGQATEEAIARADRLRCAAKSAGRNRVVSEQEAAVLPAVRVLLAEDDPSVVKILTRHLGREGFEIVAFPDGEQALAHAATSGAALVISDIEMPNLDGLGFLRGLRAHPALQHIPVMMLTAMGDENHIVRAFELGADDYVLKPFSLREVTARIRRLLRRPSLAGVRVPG